MIVRWLGAYGRTRADSFEQMIQQMASFEKGVKRQVAAECLRKGRSYLSAHIKVGLLVDEGRTTFVKGFIRDAYTRVEPDGTLRHTSPQAKAIRCRDRFVAAVQKCTCPTTYSEVVLDYPKYSRVILKKSGGEYAQRIANALAEELGVPVQVIRG